MTKLTKALLLSAFVYPGAGQLFLKHYKTGIGFVIITSIGLYFIIDNILKIAYQLADDITMGGAIPDSADLLNTFSQSDSAQLNNVAIIISITWLISLLHTYFVGRETD
jgi:hypothetical protein